MCPKSASFGHGCIFSVISFHSFSKCDGEQGKNYPDCPGGNNSALQECRGAHSPPAAAFPEGREERDSLDPAL